MQSFPQLSKLRKVNPLVLILVCLPYQGLGLHLTHVPAHPGDEGLQLLNGDHAITVSIKKLERLRNLFVKENIAFSFFPMTSFSSASLAPAMVLVCLVLYLQEE